VTSAGLRQSLLSQAKALRQLQAEFRWFSGTRPFEGPADGLGRPAIAPAPAAKPGPAANSKRARLDKTLSVKHALLRVYVMNKQLEGLRGPLPDGCGGVC